MQQGRVHRQVNHVMRGADALFVVARRTGKPCSDGTGLCRSAPAKRRGGRTTCREIFLFTLAYKVWPLPPSTYAFFKIGILDSARWRDGFLGRLDTCWCLVAGVSPVSTIGFVGAGLIAGVDDGAPGMHGVMPSRVGDRISTCATSCTRQCQRRHASG